MSCAAFVDAIGVAIRDNCGSAATIVDGSGRFAANIRFAASGRRPVHVEQALRGVERALRGVEQALRGFERTPRGVERALGMSGDLTSRGFELRATLPAGGRPTPTGIGAHSTGAAVVIERGARLGTAIKDRPASAAPTRQTFFPEPATRHGHSPTSRHSDHRDRNATGGNRTLVVNSGPGPWVAPGARALSTRRAPVVAPLAWHTEIDHARANVCGVSGARRGGLTRPCGVASPRRAVGPHEPGTKPDISDSARGARGRKPSPRPERHGMRQSSARSRGPPTTMITATGALRVESGPENTRTAPLERSSGAVRVLRGTQGTRSAPPATQVDGVSPIDHQDQTGPENTRTAPVERSSGAVRVLWPAGAAGLGGVVGA